MRRLFRLLLALGIPVLALGCTPAERAAIPVLSTVDSIGIATAHVMGWCSDHGIEPATVASAAKALAEKDYKTAVPLLSSVVDKAIAAGDAPDAETQAFIRLAQEVVAVQGIQDGMRALSTDAAPEANPLNTGHTPGSRVLLSSFPREPVGVALEP